MAKKSSKGLKKAARKRGWKVIGLGAIGTIAGVLGVRAIDMATPVVKQKLA